MLFFYKISKNVDSIKGNYLTSVYVNILFSILVLPSIFFAENGLICRLWFFSLIIIYTIIYFRLYRLIKIKLIYINQLEGQVAELVYALVLETSAARLKSSSLFLPTKKL